MANPESGLPKAEGATSRIRPDAPTKPLSGGRTQAVGDATPTLVEEVMEELGKSDIRIKIASQSPFRTTLEQLGRSKDENDYYASHYSVHGTIGEGGIGRVLLAYDRHLGRDVAIKELLPCEDEEDLPRRLSRFVREIKVTGQLEHPGIVPVYEVGLKKDGTLYYVMKYVRGRTMHTAIEEAGSPQDERSLGERLKLLTPLIEVCDAMGYAHSRGVVHRDLKPENIILGEFGETVILDWGLAKVQHEPQPESLIQVRKGEPLMSIPTVGLTQDGEILGTPVFMPPEQVEPEFGEVNARTDVYALGTILYFILTGRFPYEGDPLAIIERVTDRHPSPVPTERIPSLPPELVAICEKAMKKRQAERFAHAGRMAEQLRAYRDGRLVSVHAYSPHELFRRFVARNKVLMAAGSITVLALLVGTGLAVHSAVKAGAAREQAERARMSAERAVGDVAELANELERLAARTANALSSNFAQLADHMGQVAAQLGDRDLRDQTSMVPQLELLLQRYPECESFWTVTPPGKLATVAPIKYASALGSDVTHQEHIQWIFKNQKPVFSRIFELVEEKGRHAVSLQVPVFDERQMKGSLAAIIRPERVVPRYVPDELRKPGDAHWWCVQEDGYVLFDNAQRQIGSYLFRDGTCDQFPSLKQFRDRMLKEDEGVGYYRCPSSSDTHVIHRVAAWKTFSPSESTQWKVVVVEPYVVTDF